MSSSFSMSNFFRLLSQVYSTLLVALKSALFLFGHDCTAAAAVARHRENRVHHSDDLNPKEGKDDSSSIVFDVRCSFFFALQTECSRVGGGFTGGFGAKAADISPFFSKRKRGRRLLGILLPQNLDCRGESQLMSHVSLTQ